VTAMRNDRWIYNKYSTDSSVVKEIAQITNLSEVTVAVALNRGITTANALTSFISKSTKDLHSPFLMRNMDIAVESIRKAVDLNKKITVYGDYDVDGITSAAILVKYLRLLGTEADYYIPDRMDEGYGLNSHALEIIKANGSDMVITVDTGITAYDEVAFAKEIGLDIIVTDHHQCKDNIPDCIVINPCCPKCDYPFKCLAGVGVVFKLITAMENGDHLKVLDMFGDIIAIGTVADVVSLTDENRIIVDFGLNKLKNSPNMGLSMLIGVAGLDSKPLTVFGIGYGIAPRINAAGRIGDTAKAVDLLLSNSISECMGIAEYLDEENKCRQETESKILSDVLKIIKSNNNYEDKKVIVISGCGWHHGVIGIVASKISDRYTKPCILISCENGIGKGSGRSVKGFNLFEALKSCSDLFEKFGGHELAAGLTISQQNIEKAEQLLNEFALENMPPECNIPCINIDFELSPDNLTAETAENLSLLEPFGTDNRQPCFSICGATILNKRLMGNSKHTRFSMSKNGVIFDVIAFNDNDLFYSLIEDDVVDIAGILSINEWRNTKRVQIILKSLKLGTFPAPISLVPTRDDLVAIYLYIKMNCTNLVLHENTSVLARKITYSTKRVFDIEKLFNCLEIFAELKLMTFAQNIDEVDIYLLRTDGSKVNLESSKKLEALRNSELEKNG